MEQKLKAVYNTSGKQKAKLAARARFASFMEMSEQKFGHLIIETEKDPLFKKFLFAGGRGARLLKYSRFPGASFSSSTIEFNDALACGGQPLDVEGFSEERAGAVASVRKIGLEKFRKYFLDSEEALEPAKLCSICGISEHELALVIGLVNDIAVRGEFYHPSGLNQEAESNYFKIASVAYDSEGFPLISFYSPKYAQGRYIINRDTLEDLKRSGYFSEAELPGIEALVNRLEKINLRKSTIFQAVSNIALRQKDYITSGNECRLVEFTQKALSAVIGVDSSIVSRAIYKKSVELPDGTEKPISFFFPSKQDLCSFMIRDLIGGETSALSDDRIRKILAGRHNFVVSRRTVALCRKESGIDTYIVRRKARK
ncbi:MAG TPA: hypothetical protein DEE98_04715 [Elusimicrobia bacterium]|nr:MAG: hypothetical protein A2278_04400 [Elusimicrobia bacterium RIFOXYA12_FULL_49_49]OGS07153.1 MAG: hypothetical protein A2204_06360 [Elusimicrobia bacterium RIFOXYA1_FULL_47_7]OGS10486.1 MAG: hypothetical protein A2386_05265 [Elusimicrobia bacterium RIFOXYB1_FULL_48_9]OGS14709.1 MAG: hypothetical protein A2251_09440 [Elusimicrobia bacterium RIFOXYA2_FULL_47_53]OGS25639.1 MAG: hypothetical protein A2339_06150 [Elusimicrobia bacterium RIFOXYB12_FULL_50_12]OGS31800.1 MAG: hypothetical protein